MITLINPGSGLVIYDAQGHGLGGGERLDVPELDSVAERAIELGQLLREEKPNIKGSMKKAGSGDEAKKADEAESATPARRDGKS
jgi:hypothetical protein